MSVSVATPTSSSSSPASTTMVETDPATRPIYPSNLEPGKANLAAFLSPILGYQFQSPGSSMVAGISTVRTIVASSRMAAARPNPTLPAEILEPARRVAQAPKLVTVRQWAANKARMSHGKGRAATGSPRAPSTREVRRSARSTTASGR